MIFLSFFLDYIEMNDNMVTGLMMRHRTLSDTNGQLVDNLLAMADEVIKFSNFSKQT